MLQETHDGATAARPVATPIRSASPDAQSKDADGNEAVGDKPQDEKNEQDEKPHLKDVKNTALPAKSRQEPFPSSIDFHPACMVLGSANCRNDSLSLYIYIYRGFTVGKIYSPIYMVDQFIYMVVGSLHDLYIKRAQHRSMYD